ncbi:MAG: hypothetical protein HZC37_11410 [Burkholderiales bacterium]|nr:hypothetical protein [Burkholderiales bacterium]
MQFDECFEGDYRIFVGALDAPRGEGFIAAVVVSRLFGAEAPGADDGGDAADGNANAPRSRRAREVWRDDSLACGYRWPTPEAALHYAKNRAREMVRKASPMLASVA